METFIPWTLVKRGVRREVITSLDTPGQFQEEVNRERQDSKAAEESALTKALGLAHYWQRLLDEGKFRSITEIAAAEGMDVGQFSRIAKLAQLAPEIIEICMLEKEKASRLETLLRQSALADWGSQKQEIVFA